MRGVVCEGWDATEQSRTQFLKIMFLSYFFLFLFTQICFLPFKAEQKAFKHAYIKTNYLITLT